MVEWLGRNLKKGLWGAVTAGLGAATGFFWDDVNAQVRYWVQEGNLGGAYLVRTWVYKTKDERIPYQVSVDLKHGGEKIFGTLESLSGAQWKFYGYVKQKFVGLSYGRVKKGGLGTGTFALQQDIDDAFWGTGIQVECIGPDAMYVRCPAVMYRKGNEHKIAVYDGYLQRPCEQILLQAPARCDAAKQQ